ncbi:MAG: RAMP superfamily CRISPR-associated protein [Candidatus Sericytochromatia bacterium]
MQLKLIISLESDALIASGEGYGAVIDSDIIFDDLGIPYIPAKRIKGCLKDSLKEISEIFFNSNIGKTLPLDLVFGNNYENIQSEVNFSNLTIEEYNNNYEWLKYFTTEKDISKFISQNLITSFFTDIRQQTCIDEKDGVSKDHSLRTSRVLKKGLKFEGFLDINNERELILDFIILACINLRRIGSNRTRGFGEISCEIYDDKNNLLNNTLLKKLEALCK